MTCKNTTCKNTACKCSSKISALPVKARRLYPDKSPIGLNIRIAAVNGAFTQGLLDKVGGYRYNNKYEAKALHDAYASGYGCGTEVINPQI